MSRDGFRSEETTCALFTCQNGHVEKHLCSTHVNLLWRFNFKCRPPHFVPFYIVFLNFSLYFGVLWGGIMWFVQWRNDGDSAEAMLLKILSAGVTFGLIMTVYYAFSRWFYRLPAWEDV